MSTYHRSPTFMSPQSLDERIEALEHRVLPKGSVPGTVLIRVLPQSGGVQWSLGIGRLQEPQDFFDGATIAEAVSLAERSLLKKKG